ncbi:hypothetical protein AAFC00_005447 [Neodothiora populina]|uniref:tRNA (guanine(10)-N(2))-methyltransferase n=1 Tax=Neodothiora populina TaxID=2781224 RepID=A0ABR3PM05_9PEZI
MEYLVRFVQIHETFRLPELRSLSALAGVEVEVVEYSDDSPYCIIKLQTEDDAKRLIRRSILAAAIYELWGIGPDYASLHEDVKERSSHLWPQYKTGTFSFQIDSFKGKRNQSDKSGIIESFKFVGFTGKITMKNPDEEFVILEEYPHQTTAEPKRVALGRLLGMSTRSVVQTYDLKKRKYISTTSMDSELALVTANMALAGPGKLMYDPFTGTGSFPIACAEFGTTVLGSDIDGRSIRGTPKRNVVSNFVQYGTLHRYLDGFVSDLTNSPLRGCLGGLGGRKGRWLDGIVCDPPYGVREGLKVLGSVKEDLKKEVILPNGVPAHLQAGYIPPKRAYSFEAMLDDILDFGYDMLVDNGRLCMWMPTANDEDTEIAIPSHPAMRLVSVSVQQFNKWARRLLTYERIPEDQIDEAALRSRIRKAEIAGTTASELNAFRRKYFEGFRDQPVEQNPPKRRGFWISPSIWIR